MENTATTADRINSVLLKLITVEFILLIVLWLCSFPIILLPALDPPRRGVWGQGSNVQITGCLGSRLDKRQLNGAM